VYRFVEGMTVTQIATAMHISEPTARRSFSRAWTRMQKWAAADPFLNDYLLRRRLDVPVHHAALDDEALDSVPAELGDVPSSGYSVSRGATVHYLSLASGAEAQARSSSYAI